MAIKIIKSNTITLTQEKYDRLLREWSASQQYTTVPQSFDSWVREYIEAEQTALAAAPHAASHPEDENDAHNFAICQHFDNWLIEKGALLTPHSEESDGPMAPALNWIASVEAMVAARAPAESVLKDATHPIAVLVSELRKHRFCGDCYPENGWPGVNDALAQYELWKRAARAQKEGNA
jgi:hypothetical protein